MRYRASTYGAAPPRVAAPRVAAPRGTVPRGAARRRQDDGGGGKYEYTVSEDAKAFLAETIAAEKAKADADAGAR